MAVIDYVIIAVIVISALVSFARGFLREALSLVAWALAIASAFSFAPDAAPYFGRWLADATLQYWAAVVAVFLATLFVCGIINWLIGQLFSEFGTSGTDRSLGILLGAARGAVVVALLLMGAKVLSLPVEKWGENSKIYPHITQFSDWLWQVGSDMAEGWSDKVGPATATASDTSAPVAAEPNGDASQETESSPSINTTTEAVTQG